MSFLPSKIQVFSSQCNTLRLQQSLRRYYVFYDELNILLKPDDVYQNLAVLQQQQSFCSCCCMNFWISRILDSQGPLLGPLAWLLLLLLSSPPWFHPLWDKVHPQYPYYYFDEKSIFVKKGEAETYHAGPHIFLRCNNGVLSIHILSFILQEYAT